MKTISAATAIVLIFLFSCNTEEGNTTIKKEVETINPILGAWEMAEIHWITSDTTYSINKAQPGIFLFTPKRYSIMWTPVKETRVPFVDLSKPTEKEIIYGFQSVVFNGGTYTFTDSTVTTVAKIAKVPGFEEGIQFYKYIINKDTLFLTMFDEIYPDGTKPGWSGKYKTQFVMLKAK